VRVASWWGQVASLLSERYRSFSACRYLYNAVQGVS
jgi:hypothetical protein